MIKMDHRTMNLNIYDSNLKPKKSVEMLKKTLKDKNTSPLYFD